MPTKQNACFLNVIVVASMSRVRRHVQDCSAFYADTTQSTAEHAEQGLT